MMHATKKKQKAKQKNCKKSNRNANLIPGEIGYLIIYSDLAQV
jgi:hypothetical protein